MYKEAIQDAISTHELPSEWSSALLSEAENVARKKKTTKYRKDLRKLPFVTIDGEDAKDFDDAIYCVKNTSGYRLYVAIADVGAYGASLSSNYNTKPLIAEIIVNWSLKIPNEKSKWKVLFSHNKTGKWITCKTLLVRYLSKQEQELSQDEIAQKVKMFDFSIPKKLRKLINIWKRYQNESNPEGFEEEKTMKLGKRLALKALQKDWELARENEPLVSSRGLRDETTLRRSGRSVSSRAQK